MSETFMKERPILPLLASMALPMVLSMLVNSLYNIVDSFFVAKISEEAMTALSLVYPVQNFINAVAIGFGVGINAVIAIGLGAGDRRRADAAAAQGIALSALHGLILTAACIAIMPSFLARFTSDPAVIQMGLQYSGIAFSFSVIIMLGLSFEKLFQAVGRMKITMAALLAGCIANIILDPLLIFGPGPFPELGISGAALATGIGQVLTLAVYLAAYRLFPIPVRLRRSCLKPDGPLIRKLYAVGVPAILNLALPSLLISVLNGLLSVYSQSYVTILGIYYKLQTFLYLPASGLVQGMRPIIGYNHGAGERKRVRQIFLLVLLLCALLMLLGTILSLAVPGRLIALFSDNAETIAAGAGALRIISLGFIVSSVSVAASGALEGLGKGLPSLWISLFRYVIIIIPLAYILSIVLGWGPDGVWTAFWVSEVVSAIFSIIICRRSFLLLE